MTAHAKPFNDKVDLGHRLFLLAFFLPFALGSSFATVGYGATGSVQIPIVGTAAVLGLVFVASMLYRGSKLMQRALIFVAIGLLGGAVTVFLVSRSLAGWLIAFQMLMPVLFTAIILIPATRAFLAFQRGEEVAKSIETKPTEPSAPTPSPATFESLLESGGLREGAAAAILTHSRLVRLAGVLVACAALAGIVLAIMSLVGGRGGWLLILASVCSLPCVFMFLHQADHWYYLATTKGYEKIHLKNASDESQSLSTCATVVLALIVLLAILDFVLR